MSKKRDKKQKHKKSRKRSDSPKQVERQVPVAADAPHAPLQLPANSISPQQRTFLAKFQQMHTQFIKDVQKETLQKVLAGEEVSTSVEGVQLNDSDQQQEPERCLSATQLHKKLMSAILQKRQASKTSKQHLKIQD